MSDRDFGEDEAEASPLKGPRIPPEVDGIQVNHCKSPQCVNFSYPASPNRPYRRNGTPSVFGDYIVGTSNRDTPSIKCAFCNEKSPIRSNQAIAEEYTRLGNHLYRQVFEPSCKTEDCSMREVPLSQAGSQYIAFGKTSSGTQRYRCLECKKTFTGAQKPTSGQRRPEKNRDVFILMVNRVPLSRIVETTTLSPQAVYDKMEFIYKQCRLYSGAREAKLLESDFILPKMYVAVDRQYYLINWLKRDDRRAVQLNAIATADLKSGYVFGMHLNFDESAIASEIEAAAAAAGDAHLTPPFRRYARLWLAQDYTEGLTDAQHRVVASITSPPPGFNDALLNEIVEEYADADARADIEESDFKNKELQLPKSGMQVRETYTMYAHFQLVARFLKNAPKVRVFMDQDSGFRAAFMSAYRDRIKARTADGFFVKVAKDATAYQKQRAVIDAKKKLIQFMAENGITDEYSAQVEMMKLNVKAATPIGRWGDKWVSHPMPIASEPRKQISWQTNLGDYDENHEARLLLKPHCMLLTGFL